MKKTEVSILLSTLLTVSLLTGCGKNVPTLAATAKEIKTVETTVVKLQALQQVAELSGTLEPIEKTLVSFEVGGRILELDKKLGDTVQVGDILGLLDSSDYQLAVKKAETGISQAQASLAKLNDGARPEDIEQAKVLLEKAQLNADNAKENLKRITSLYQSGAVSKNEYDQALLRSQQADQDVKNAQLSLSLLVEGARKEDKDAASALLQQSLVQKEQAESSLQKTRLISPVAGTVIAKLLDNGQIANSGIPVYEIGDTKQLKVILPVPDREISNWSVGDKVSLDLYGDKRDGYVDRIDPQTNSGTGTIGVEVKVDNSNHKWITGQVVTATHQLKAVQGLFVPVAAVISTGGPHPYVFVVKNHKAIKTNVVIGRLLNNQLEIRSGLAAGDVIVTKGADRLFDGDPVQAGGGEKQ